VNHIAVMAARLSVCLYLFARVATVNTRALTDTSPSALTVTAVRCASALGRARVELDRRAQRPGCEVADIQLLARVCAAPSYGAWKRDQERAWRRQGGRYSTASWPAQLGDDETAVVLLPLDAGRVGLAAGKQPRAVADPVFSCGATGLRQPSS
jgi:hypothetical protein